MGIVPKFTSKQISILLGQKAKDLEAAIIMRLQRLGEDCVNHARTSGDYTDQTGNLRSSIGYVVVANGKVVQSNFLQAGSGSVTVQSVNIKTKKVASKTMKGGGDGVLSAKSLADKLSQKFATGYALIVVAGMDYAYHVESTGRDVLSSAEHLAESKIAIILSQLRKKLN